MANGNPHRYLQTAIGDCGHVVSTWPIVGGVHGHNGKVICDTCSRGVYGIDSNEPFIWVGVVKQPRKKRAPSKPRKRVPPKPKRKSGIQLLLELEGL